MAWASASSVLRRGVKQFRRQIVAQAVAVTIMAVALSLAGAAFGLHRDLDRLVSRLNQELRLIVFLKPVPQAEMGKLAEDISAWAGVQGIISVSSQEALERIKVLLGPQSGLVDGLGAEVMPPLLEIQLTAEGLEPDNLEALKKKLQGLEAVDEVAFAQVLAERLKVLAGRLKTLGQWLAGALILAGLFIIFATIRLALLAHLEEIKILRLIGATAWFIRGPFLVQGAGQGLAAALLALILMAVFQSWANLALSGLLIRLNLLDLELALRLLGAGMATGLAGAWLALGRVKGN
ncbi:MAG: hypothetical protein JRJ59_02905 [Deltaproteobacteria bacterium]|nr:hypothetical protein [Deltaproteobacteria bacterium]